MRFYQAWRIAAAGKPFTNNFCLCLGSNDLGCNSYHAGYGWIDKSFDFTHEQNEDYLVCYDTTGTYRKVL
jgi:hypothetical protein